MATAKEESKMRNIHAEIHSTRGGAGAGKHKPKSLRGTGKRGKGKSQRHPKHKGERYVTPDTTEG